MRTDGSLFDAHRGKLRSFGLAYAVFCIGYAATGRLALKTPTPLPEMGADRMIPFVEGSVWIYLMQFVFLPVAILSMSPERMNRALRSMALASLISFAAFLAFPTMIPRSHIPTHAASAWLFQLIQMIDTPTNCCPSLHVSLAFLAALHLGLERRSWRWTSLLIAVLISISTMTVKQHYALDVGGGFLVALICWGAEPLLWPAITQESNAASGLSVSRIPGGPS